MGRVPRGRAFKGHAGAPANLAIGGVATALPDSESIETAVKGTSSGAPAAIGDFISLVQLANWQMLDELESGVLRGMEPTEYRHFAGYPRPTVTVVATKANSPGSIVVTIDFTLNNKVGFDFTVYFTVRVSVRDVNEETGQSTARTASRNSSITVPAGAVQGQWQQSFLLGENTLPGTGTNEVLLSNWDQTHYYGPATVTVT